MFTCAFDAISRVEAPANPLTAKTPSAAARISALVEAGASRAFSNAERMTVGGLIKSIDPEPSFRRDAPGLSTKAPKINLSAMRWHQPGHGRGRHACMAALVVLAG